MEAELCFILWCLQNVEVYGGDSPSPREQPPQAPRLLEGVGQGEASRGWPWKLWLGLGLSQPWSLGRPCQAFWGGHLEDTEVPSQDSSPTPRSCFRSWVEILITWACSRKLCNTGVGVSRGSLRTLSSDRTALLLNKLENQMGFPARSVRVPTAVPQLSSRTWECWQRTPQPTGRGTSCCSWAWAGAPLTSGSRLWPRGPHMSFKGPDRQGLWVWDSQEHSRTRGASPAVPTRGLTKGVPRGVPTLPHRQSPAIRCTPRYTWDPDWFLGFVRPPLPGCGSPDVLNGSPCSNNSRISFLDFAELERRKEAWGPPRAEAMTLWTHGPCSASRVSLKSCCLESHLGTEHGRCQWDVVKTRAEGASWSVPGGGGW